MVDDADAIAALDLLDVVRGDDHGQLALRRTRSQILPHALARLRIEADGRLVEKQDAGIVHQRARDLEPPLHAGGERAHQPLAPFASSTRASISSMRARRTARGHAVDEPVELEILLDRQAVVEARLLEHDAEMRRARADA